MAEGGALCLADDAYAQPLAPPDCPILIDGDQLAHSHAIWLAENGRNAARMRKWTLVLGVDDARERVRLLRMGFGDVVGHDTPLEEVEVRARRIADLGETLSRYRNYGVLRLDLLQRDGYVAGKAVGLHPREFALLWRLMEAPGEPVDKAELLSEVWRLTYVPETNSIAVHVSRLRGKMARAGLNGWVQTSVAGGYYLADLPGRARHLGRAVEKPLTPVDLSGYLLTAK